MSNRVTIGIPVYNSEKYIKQTMLSALSQTHDDLEILVVDDCGTDSSMTIVEELKNSHPRGSSIHILRNEANSGVGPSRNRLIDEAEGQFVFFLDSDDTIEPHTIERMLREQEKTGADIVFASSDRIDHIDNTVEPGVTYQKMTFTKPDQLPLYAFSNYGKFQTIAISCLISTELLREKGIRFINVAFWEDMAFIYDLLPKTEKAVLLPDILYHYHCHEGSLSNYQEREQVTRDEVLRNMSTIDYMKKKCALLEGEPYTPYICYNLQMNSFYLVCYVLKNAKHIVPRIAASELKSFMTTPMPLSSMLHFRRKRATNIILWLVSKMPTHLFIHTIKAMGKIKKAI